MSRRLLGPVGGAVAFFLVATLVFAGLGWVTYSALGVEKAQREAAARNEIGNNLRVALWRLDGRMLPALGVEDSRPVYHYDSADPAGIYGPAATPLLAATLPDWMKLHFQVDPADGWRSNQAPADPGEANRIREVWADLPLRNYFDGREAVLAELKAKFPAKSACELFAARDRTMTGDALPLASALFAEAVPTDPLPPTPKPPPPEPPASVTPVAPSPPARTYHILGFDLYVPSSDATQQATNPPMRFDTQQQLAVPLKQSEQSKVQQSGNQLNGPYVVMRGNRGGPNDDDYARRAQTFGKGLEEAKNAYDSPNARNSLQNYAQMPGQNQLDFRNFANSTGPVQTACAPNKDAPPNTTANPIPVTGTPLAGGGGFNPPNTAPAASPLVMPPPVPPGEDRPPQPAAPFFAPPPVPAPVAVHLGSMRPQWVTAPDGTEMLVLVRAGEVREPHRVSGRRARLGEVAGSVASGGSRPVPGREASSGEEPRGRFPGSGDDRVAGATRPRP